MSQYALTAIKYLYELEEHKKHLIQKVINEVVLPESGLIIIVDSEDYDSNIYPSWGDLGLHMNLSNGIEDISPPYLYDLMVSRKYSNIVWLSGRTSKDIPTLVWSLSHELRHYYQDSISSIISRCGYFLYHTMGFIDSNFTYMDLPHEVDAELFGWEISKKVLGEEVAEEFIQKMINRYPSYAKLREFKERAEYNMIKELINVLKKYKNELMIAQILDHADEITRQFKISQEINNLEYLLLYGR
ncbi:hypothetical protein NLX71_13635 [Paenibacillus sp. MZ04-78.2]|uniref:hypothetical protein n=1 Tax=Paenibacillus sp. MZ04-78.2 TaxID=2962034 RepID=UPI0020B6B8B1|nr:hypothetical protein [Paenibacillus sp. MZ04-78.2]MCP3774339.1 hypothetical protein [Paenibacillus sp. MZ04-78.2]